MNINVNELMEKKTVVMGKEFPTVALIGGTLALVAIGAMIVVKNRKKTV